MQKLNNIIQDFSNNQDIKTAVLNAYNLAIDDFYNAIMHRQSILSSNVAKPELSKKGNIIAFNNISNKLKSTAEKDISKC